MSVFPYDALFNVRYVENGIVGRQQTYEGLDITFVYEGDGNRSISRVVEDDMLSLLEKAEKERYFNHLRISVTIEDLTEEGGAQ
jgi:hypothetical protein